MKPSYTVQIGFGISDRLFVLGRSRLGRAVLGGPLTDAGVAWTTVDGVREIHCSRGRSDALGQVSSQPSTVVLGNEDGRFSPENAASIYAPNVRPWRRVRAYATFNGTDYPLLYGWGRFRPKLDSNDLSVTVEVADIFSKLERDEISEVVPQELIGARVQRVLAGLELPSAMRDIDAGQSTLPTVTLSQATRLQHIQDIMAVEDGLFYGAGSGKATFRDRHARLTRAASVTSQATFGGAAGLPYQPGDYDDGADYVLNKIRALRTGGVEQSADDEDSQTEYGIGVHRLNSDHFLNDSQAEGYCRYRRGEYRNPVPRIRSIRLEGGGDDALWMQMLMREILDRVTVVHQFPGAMGINHDYWIQSVRHDVTDGLNRHAVEWSLSKAGLVEWFRFGVSKFGTGRLGY